MSVMCAREMCGSGGWDEGVCCGEWSEVECRCVHILTACHSCSSHPADTDMGDAGFLALCRHLPASQLKSLFVEANRITTIPAPFSRFQKLKCLFTHGNSWAEGGWRCSGHDVEIARSALKWARKLVRHLWRGGGFGEAALSGPLSLLRDQRPPLPSPNAAAGG